MESKIQIGMRLADKLDISINGTILVVGHVTHIYIEEDGYNGNKTIPRTN